MNVMEVGERECKLTGRPFLQDLENADMNCASILGWLT